MKKLKSLFFFAVLPLAFVMLSSCGKDEPEASFVDYVKITKEGEKDFVMPIEATYFCDAYGNGDIVFMADPYEELTPDQKTEPSCDWFMIDVPEHLLNTENLTDVDKLDTALWKFWYSASAFNNRVRRSSSVKSVDITTEYEKNSYFSISMTLKTIDGYTVVIKYGGTPIFVVGGRAADWMIKY